MSSPNETRPFWAVPALSPTSSWGPPDLGLQAGGPVPNGSPDEKAYGLGFEDGYAEGAARVAERLEPVRKLLADLLNEVERERSVVRRDAETNISALALVVARWLFQREIDIDPATLETLVRRAVALLPPGAPIEITLHPTDLLQLSGHLELKEPDGRLLAVHWVGDGSLDRGSFRLIGPQRLVDGRADVALRSLYERLAGE